MKKTPVEIANEWYSEELVFNSLNLFHTVTKSGLIRSHSWEQIPPDTTSRKFSDWLTEQLRMAMAKGIQLGRQEE